MCLNLPIAEEFLPPLTLNFTHSRHFIMRKRLLTAIPLILVVLAAFFIPGVLGQCIFALFATALLIGAVREAYTLCGMPKLSEYEIATDAFGVLSLLGAIIMRHCNGWAVGIFAWDTLLTIITLLAAFCILFKRGLNQLELRNMGIWALITLAYAWSLMFLPKLYFLPGGHGALLICFLVVVTKLSDIGAYFVGVTTAKLPGGNHKLAPVVSPKKSWEGLAGGIAFALLGAIIFKLSVGDKLSIGACGLAPCTVNWIDAILLGLVAPTAGLLGDLAESALKRIANAKDSGHLPGLGGVLDFLDSLMPMGALFYAWLLLKMV